MSNLASRLLTALVAVPILIAVIRWQSPWGVWALVFASVVLCLREFFAMTFQRTQDRVFGVVIGALLAVVVSLALSRHPHGVVAAIVAVVLMVLLYQLFFHRDAQHAATDTALFLYGIFYCGLLLIFLERLKLLRLDGSWVIVSLTCSWFADTGAYFAGRFLGPYWPRKLYAAVSPNKTVMGALGGLVGSVLALVLAKYWYLHELTLVDCFAIGLPASVLGQLGDLSESLLKRSVDVKDSGKLLPGHGGLLDRLDAVIFSAPYIYYYVYYFQK